MMKRKNEVKRKEKVATSWSFLRARNLLRLLLFRNNCFSTKKWKLNFHLSGVDAHFADANFSLFFLFYLLFSVYGLSHFKWVFSESDCQGSNRSPSFISKLNRKTDARGKWVLCVWTRSHQTGSWVLPLVNLSILWDLYNLHLDLNLILILKNLLTRRQFQEIKDATFAQRDPHILGILWNTSQLSVQIGWYISGWRYCKIWVTGLPTLKAFHTKANAKCIDQRTFKPAHSTLVRNVPN